IYAELARLPGVVRITCSQLIARFPLGMLSLAILLHVQRELGSYALAGLVVASVSIGEAIAVPLTSRLLGILGIRRTIVATAVVCAAALVAIALLRMPPAGFVVLGFVAGATVPPIMPAVRALYPRLVPPRYVGALFALDTSAQELIWIVGPVVATVLATTAATAAPLLLAAAVTVCGSLVFVSTPRLAGIRIDRSTAGFGRVLGVGVVIFALLTNFALVSSFTALEIAIVSKLAGDGPLAGVAIAVSSAGSLIGGVTLGRRRRGLGGLALVLGSIAIATGLAGAAPGLTLLFAALFVSGFGFAPSLTTLYALVSAALPEGEAVEAFGWLNTGSLVGAAVGTALAGIASESLGPPGAFAVATGLAVIGALCPLVAQLWVRSGPATD
ncbi:MFS transporter, partial [Kitasatospora herbaricolor]|uniref:MFS transporter n=1 Tax=Kitasatospora herbaricolor TaxID=68217 RepID=UPI0036DCD23D